MGEDEDSALRSGSRRFGTDKLHKYKKALSKVVRDLEGDPAFEKLFGGPTHCLSQIELATKNEVFHLPRDQQSRKTFFLNLEAKFLEELQLSPADRQPLRVVFKSFNQKVCN